MEPASEFPHLVESRRALHRRLPQTTAGTACPVPPFRERKHGFRWLMKCYGLRCLPRPFDKYSARLRRRRAPGKRGKSPQKPPRSYPVAATRWAAFAHGSKPPMPIKPRALGPVLANQYLRRRERRLARPTLRDGTNLLRKFILAKSRELVVHAESNQEHSVLITHRALSRLHPGVRKFILVAADTGDLSEAPDAAGLDQNQIATILPQLRIFLGPILH